VSGSEITEGPEPVRALRPIEFRDWDRTPVSDLVGGRVLAWLGGIAVLVGIVLFLALAISHGWIGQTARVLLAGGASTILVAGGVWLRGHHGRTEAATAVVGAGTAGLFATLIVAGDVYRLAPPVLCLAGSLIVGAIATLLAIRWAGQAIGGLGLGGALLAPILLGAPSDLTVVGMLLVAGACATCVCARRQWPWLGLASVVICAPQWAGWALADRSAIPELLVLAGFGLLGLAGGVAVGRGSGSGDAPRLSIASVSLNACLAGVVGYVGLGAAAGHTASILWLVGLAAAHVCPAVTDRFGRIPRGTRQVLLSVAAVLADVAFGLTAHGIVLTIGWGALSVVLAWTLRRDPDDAELVELGLGAHIALVLIRVVLVAPPDSLISDRGSLVGLLSIGTLAASALASARLSGGRRPAGAAALDGLGLLAIAYLTAGALDGAALTTAWAVEGLALTRIAARSRAAGRAPWLGGLAFLGLAAVHALGVDAPPGGLLTGTHDLGAAAVGLAAVGGATLAAGRLQPPASSTRRTLIGACAITGLYLGSIAVVTAFQAGTADRVVSALDLPVREQAQVALSALWSLAGLAALTVGLRHRLSAVRTGGLAVLLVAVVKVFAYDLSTLDSIYRVISVLTLGLLLLLAALTYQRLRPPPPPDLRTVHPSQR